MLSSFGEMEYACATNRPAGADVPEYRPWDPFSACKQKYPITTYQPVYYVADSLVRTYCYESISEGYVVDVYVYHALTV